MRASVLLTSLFLFGCGRSTGTDASPTPVAAETKPAPGTAGDAGARVDDAGAKVDDASAKVDDAGAKVDDAGAKVDDAGAKVDDAGAKVDDASAKVDPSEPADPSERTGPPVGEGWCVLLGTTPLEGRGSGYSTAFDRAHALAKKAREAGFAKAAIYDAREFTTFTWGQLVVIADVFPDEAAAKASAALAKQAKLNPMVKQCSGPEAKAIAGPSQIPKDFVLEQKAPDLALFDVTQVSGCFAWSMKEIRALCRRSESSIQAGGQDLIEVIPPSPDFEPIVLAKREPQTFDEVKLVLSPADKKRLEAEIVRGKYAALTAEKIVKWMRPIAPKGTLRWAPNLAVTWKRKTTRQTIPQAGSWNDYEDTLQVTCGDLSFDWVVERHSDEEPEAYVGYLDYYGALILGWSDHWMIEGDGGGSTHGGVFDLSPCAAALKTP